MKDTDSIKDCKDWLLNATDAEIGYLLERHGRDIGIYPMRDFDKVFSDYTPSELVGSLADSFHLGDDFFRVEVDNIVSWSTAEIAAEIKSPEFVDDYAEDFQFSYLIF